MSLIEDSTDFAYDLTIAKRIEHPMSSDVLLRVTLTGIVSVMLWLTFDLWPMLIVMGCYALTLVSHGTIVAMMPRVVGRTAIWVLQGGAMLSGLAWNAGLVFLWFQDDTAVRIVAVAGLFVSMINALMLRHHDRYLARVGFLTVVVGLIALPAVSWWGHGAGGEAISLLITSSMVFVFFSYGMIEIHKMKQDLEAARIKAADRSRMESIGRLTGGVAHDFNNLLTTIGGNLELIQEIKDPAQKDELARQASFATDRAAKITGRLLKFVGRAKLAPGAIDVTQCIAIVVDKLDRALPSSIAVEWSHEPDLPQLMLDADGLEDTLFELCLNARKAMPHGGAICISAQRIASDDRKGAGVRPGEFIGIEIADNGVGIPPSAVSRVCEPYYSVDGRSVGGGLGLSAANGFVAQSGGTLSINSAVGKGTTVTLLFPIPTPARSRNKQTTVIA